MSFVEESTPKLENYGNVVNRLKGGVDINWKHPTKTFVNHCKIIRCIHVGPKLLNSSQIHHKTSTCCFFGNAKEAKSTMQCGRLLLRSGSTNKCSLFTRIPLLWTCSNLASSSRSSASKLKELTIFSQSNREIEKYFL